MIVKQPEVTFPLAPRALVRLARSKPDWVICGHLNLLRAAWLLARLRGARLALIIHGIEAWERRSWLYGLMLKSVDSFIAMSPT
jgi:hypothetical protein